MNQLSLVARFVLRFQMGCTRYAESGSSSKLGLRCIFKSNMEDGIW